MSVLPDMGGLLLDRSGAVRSDGTVDERDVFVASDGGILDNIPIGRALDAIARAPADGVTRRLLVYLQPGASSLSTSMTAPAIRSISIGLPGMDEHGACATATLAFSGRSRK